MEYRFTKEFTRDNSLIIQEVWYRAHLIDVFKNKNPYIPPIIFYLNNGVVEVWHNKKALKWYKNNLLKKNKEDKDFVNKSVKRYELILNRLNNSFHRKYLDSVKDLKEFIQLVDKGTKYFLIFYYSVTDKRTPVVIKKKAKKVREADTYYDDCNRVIKNTLSYLFPKMRGLEISITRKDLDSLPTVKVFKSRWQNCVMIPDSILKVIDLKLFLKKHKNYKFRFHRVESKNLIKGQVAYKGIAKGRVKIIKREEQIKNVKNRDILVSPMTLNKFIPAMKKAVAFVTDEGGTMCHAAIIAREMKIPCIVGTKIATQVLKDGDRVEVDANRGIVRKL